MSSMGYTRREVEEALKLNKYDDIMATYLLLFKKSSEVGVSEHLSIATSASVLFDAVNSLCYSLF